MTAPRGAGGAERALRRIGLVVGVTCWNVVAAWMFWLCLTDPQMAQSGAGPLVALGMLWSIGYVTLGAADTWGDR